MDPTIRKIIITICVLWGASMQSQQAQELFLQGNKEYEKGDFSQALSHYKAIKNKGAAVWYNMGNCFYHTHNFVQAIVCWQRSLPGASAALYADAQHNCAQAYQKLGKSMEDSWADTIVDYAHGMPTIVIQILFLFCWFLIWFILVQWQKTWIINCLIVLLLLSSLYLGSILWYRYQRQLQYGIITDGTTPLYVGPHTQYHTLGTIDSGQKVLLMQKRSDWYKVAKDGVCGWIPASAIEVVNHQS
jgi:tetratricopeptide (TPR) repeat protein